ENSVYIFTFALRSAMEAALASSSFPALYTSNSTNASTAEETSVSMSAASAMMCVLVNILFRYLRINGNGECDVFISSQIGKWQYGILEERMLLKGRLESRCRKSRSGCPVNRNRIELRPITRQRDLRDTYLVS